MEGEKEGRNVKYDVYEEMGREREYMGPQNIVVSPLFPVSYCGLDLKGSKGC